MLRSLWKKVSSVLFWWRLTPESMERFSEKLRKNGYAVSADDATRLAMLLSEEKTEDNNVKINQAMDTFLSRFPQ